MLPKQFLAHLEVELQVPVLGSLLQVEILYLDLKPVNVHLIVVDYEFNFTGNLEENSWELKINKE